MDNVKSNNEEQEDSKDSAFYLDAAKYWQDVPPTGTHCTSIFFPVDLFTSLHFFFTCCSFYIVDGMLGGLSSISDIDLKGSQRFLNTIYQVLCCINYLDF